MADTRNDLEFPLKLYAERRSRFHRHAVKMLSTRDPAYPLDVDLRRAHKIAPHLVFIVQLTEKDFEVGADAISICSGVEMLLARPYGNTSSKVGYVYHPEFAASSRSARWLG